MFMILHIKGARKSVAMFYLFYVLTLILPTDNHKGCHKELFVVWDLVDCHSGPKKNESNCDTLDVSGGSSLCGG